MGASDVGCSIPVRRAPVGSGVDERWSHRTGSDRHGTSALSTISAPAAATHSRQSDDRTAKIIPDRTALFHSMLSHHRRGDRAVALIVPGSAFGSLQTKL
jgi:hypothetical protein